jgi:hypothetical protein
MGVDSRLCLDTNVSPRDRAARIDLHTDEPGAAAAFRVGVVE